tara:strand:- start:895 stop:1149 length:255 start_codon:yes stop_codon:yes gene_type:complete
MSKDFLTELADALLGTEGIRGKEIPRKWYVCVSDRQGGIKKHVTRSLMQAQLTLHDWSATGWPAWIQDEDGQPVVIAKKAEGTN